MNVKNELHKLREELRTERDEIKLRAHLLNAEIKDEWEEVEKMWHQFESRVGAKTKAAGRVTENVATASRELGKDIKAAYQRFRSSM